MERNTKKLRSIWGKWWEPLRKWFYPVWLIYETSIRFYDYAQAVHIYIVEQLSSIGEIGVQAAAIFCAIATFAICTVFLTAPACFVLYKLFETENLSNTPLEEKTKPIF